MPNSTLAAPMPEPGRDQSSGATAPVDAYAHLVRSLRRIKTRQDRLARERKEHESALKAALTSAGAEIGTVAGRPVCSYKTTLKIALSQRILKARYPDITQECSDISEVATFKLLD